MKQRGLTIVSPIEKSKMASLDALLRSIGDDIEGQALIPFGKLTLLHFASWVIFPDDTPAPTLIFESNFDGEAETFLQQLVKQAQPALEKIYAHCLDYTAGGGGAATIEYLLAHVVYTDTFYVSCGGFTVTQVREESMLHDRIEGFLSQMRDAQDAATVRKRIQDFVANEPDLAWARQPAARYTLLERLRVRDFVVGVLMLMVLFGPLMLGGWMKWAIWLGIVVAVVLIIGTLRWKEAHDPSISNTPVEDSQPDRAKVEQLVSRENRLPQNHLFAITPVKPGLFRFALLKVVLAAIEFLGRVWFYKGSLGGIPSIHFARWAIIQNGKSLLFLSNFDGSWEHYLGEFIDQAANGLTAVWSNAVNFPRTSYLIEGGARDEQRFKDYARGMQLYTQLWYNAYPPLSVVNVQNNAAIRAGLWGPMNGEALNAWLRRF